MKLILAAMLTLGSATLDAAVGVSHITPGFTGNQFLVYQTFDKSDHTGFQFSFISNAIYRYDGSFLDEGIDLHRVSSGDRFSQSVISNGDFQKINFGESYSLPAIFYLGLITPSRSFGTTNAAYGWAQVSNSGGVLTIIDHAIDYSGNGLIVGTTTVVPEPGVTGLMIIGLTFIIARRSRSGYPSPPCPA